MSPMNQEGHKALSSHQSLKISKPDFRIGDTLGDSSADSPESAARPARDSAAFGRRFVSKTWRVAARIQF
jgi:hypothetical protein